MSWDYIKGLKIVSKVRDINTSYACEIYDKNLLIDLADDALNKIYFLYTREKFEKISLKDKHLKILEIKKLNTKADTASFKLSTYKSEFQYFLENINNLDFCNKKYGYLHLKTTLFFYIETLYNDFLDYFISKLQEW
jgi:hypothetical protein